MAGKGIVIQITGDPASAKAALEMIREQMQETGEKAKETGGIFASAWEEAKRAFDWVVVYEAMHKAVDELVDLTKESFEFGETMLQASQKTGLSVESLSVLKYAAGELGTSFDTLVTGVGRMQKNIADAATGNKQLAADFQGMGLNAKTLAADVNGSETAFHKFVDTVAATTNVSARNKLVMDLMGRAGLEQIPVLIELSQHWDEYKERAQAAGVVMNQDTAEALANMQQKFNDLKEHVQGAGLEFTEGLIPALGQMIDVIRDGQTDRQLFTDWGRDMIKVVSLIASGFYGAASGAETLFSLAEGGRLSEIGTRDLEAAKELARKAGEFRDIAQGRPMASDVNKYLGDIHPSDLDDWASQGGAKPFKPVDTTKIHSTDPLARAAANELAEQGKAEADAQKNGFAVALAALEAHHKEMIGSEQAYLSERLKLQLGEIDSEKKALENQYAALEQLYAHQHADKHLPRDKNGQSAQELETYTKMIRLKEQMAALDAKRTETTSASDADAVLAKQTAELNNLRAAAELEKERGDGIKAQIALIEKETELAARKAGYEGQSSEAVAAIRANGQVLEQKLRIAEVDRQIQQTEAEFNAAAKEIEDREAKGQITKLQAERQLNALHQQEVAMLQSLVQQYDALAATLGGPFTEKAQELHAALSELSTPDKSKEPQFGKTVAEGMTKMAETISRQSIMGKTSFHEMVKEMEADAAELALKLMMMKILGGKNGGAGGAGGSGGGGSDGFLGDLGGVFSAMFKNLPHFAGGGSPSGPSVVGEDGPELWTPPAKGGTITPNSVLNKLSGGGGVSRAPNVTTNVINQSSQPLTAQTTQTSYDSQLHEFITHVVLSDQASNGPIAQAMKGLGGG